MAEGGQRLVLVRHGETEWARDGRHTGRTDIPLTELGRLQAMVLGDRLRGRMFVGVMTSPLSRAAETCRLAGLVHRAETSDDLMEWDYGAYEGRRTVDIRVDVPGWTIWRDGVPGAHDQTERRTSTGNMPHTNTAPRRVASSTRNTSPPPP